ncbi:MAG: hypothetical protein ACYDEC_09565 [Bacteroidia bacterium]
MNYESPILNPPIPFSLPKGKGVSSLWEDGRWVRKGLAFLLPFGEVGRGWKGLALLLPFLRKGLGIGVEL